MRSQMETKIRVLWLKQGDNYCSQMHMQVYVVAEVTNGSFRIELSNPKDYDQFVSILLVPQFKESIFTNLYFI